MKHFLFTFFFLGLVVFGLVVFGCCARGGEKSPEYHPEVKATMDRLVGYVMGRQLLAASISGNAEQVRQLLQDGAQVDFLDSYGRTPLHMAAANNRHSTVKILLQYGASVNSQDQLGRTPLMLVIFLPENPKEALESCRELKAKSANFDMVDKDGNTALSRAQSSYIFGQKSHKPLLKFLEENTKK